MEEGLIIMSGTKYTSILRGGIQFRDNLVNIVGKYNGFFKGEKSYSNIPIELVEKETELTIDHKPTGIIVHKIRQSFDGDIHTTLHNSKMAEDFNSLLNEKLALQREVNHLRKMLFDSKSNQRTQEAALRDIKWSGKVRSALYSFDQENTGYSGGFNRFSRFPMSGVPPIE